MNISEVVMTESYDRLKNATPEELLAAVIWFYTRNFPELADLVEGMLRIGFTVGRDSGWQHVAPYWLEVSRGGDEDVTQDL